MKRAQIVVADLWSHFKGKGPGEFEDISTLTMFADYRVPQALVGLEVMAYSDGFLKQLQSNPYLKPGSEEEIVIRACSIISIFVKSFFNCKELCKKCNEIFPSSSITQVEIDFYLWDWAKQNPISIPIHKTKTIYY